MQAARVPDFSGQVMAVHRVERLLQEVAEALDGAAVPYAVIGGNAVAAWVATADEGAVRATKDVDILLNREDLDSAEKALASVGLKRHDVHGVTMFLPGANPNPKTGVHVVFAGERVRESSRHAAPELRNAIRSKTGFMVLDLASLLVMKLEANRRVDQLHVEDLLRVRLVNEATVAELPTDLQERLRHIRETS